MKTLTLKRISKIPPNPTYGVLLEDGVPFVLTLERAWLNNAKGISCIPDGTYTCKRVQSPKFGDTFEVTGVVGRDSILFHKGNVEDDSHGCILIGEQFNKVNGKDGITASAIGFDEFKFRTGGIGEFTLIVETV